MPSTLELSVGPPNIEGSLFQSFAPDLLMKSQKECLVMHNHQYSISPEKLLSNAKLSSFFEILTTTKDRDNKAFVSTARARNYPVTIVQWNPEKNAFEWASSAKYPHTEDPIRVTQSTTNFFVS
ncbi:Gamma-glutamyl hydrolase [Stylosanthes scabra]|uniref:Gamma-glutamyl hydrolase n=1 Tax=Stylosanthes scabra TaxID=79078 RepID=A0ABU6YCH7_9FABA|nr:Gamma-glutamyl hydrolase [Stylosanthes scabra]